MIRDMSNPYDRGYWGRVDGTTKLSETTTAEERNGWLEADDELANEVREAAR